MGMAQETKEGDDELSLQEERSFKNILNIIEKETDFEVEYYDRSHLERRISARMHRTKASDYREYLNLLRRDDIEKDLLVEQLSVNVTGFFRDPSVWSQIKKLIRNIDEPVKAWSAACSDGREPYSLSMLLSNGNIRHNITATDIDEESLETAYRGVYESLRTSDIVEQISEFNSDLLEYVKETDEGKFKVKDVNRNVEFKEHDLIADGPMPPKDMVFCRNLFIYIDRKFRENVYSTLTESLKSGGYLIIGKTESLPRNVSEDFSTFDRENRIYVKK